MLAQYFICVCRFSAQLNYDVAVGSLNESDPEGKTGGIYTMKTKAKGYLVIIYHTKIKPKTHGNHYY